MTRNTALKILNPIMGVLVISQITTGLTGGSLPHEVFEIVHEGGGISLAVASVLHLILNWNWIRANYLSGKTADKA